MASRLLSKVPSTVNEVNNVRSQSSQHCPKPNAPAEGGRNPLPTRHLCAGGISQRTLATTHPFNMLQMYSYLATTCSASKITSHFTCRPPGKNQTAKYPLFNQIGNLQFPHARWWVLGVAHHGYRNTYFAEHGLFSLETTLALESQSLKRKPKAQRSTSKPALSDFPTGVFERIGAV